MALDQLAEHKEAVRRFLEDAQRKPGWLAFAAGVSRDRPFRDGQNGRSFTGS